MKKLLLTLTAILALGAKAEQTIYRILPSAADFDATVANISATLESKGMTIFTVIDHQEAAKQAGLDMQPAKVIIFGNPKAGTPLMQKDPRLALQLPMKILVTQTQDGVQVIYTPAARVIEGSDLRAEDIADNLAKMEKLIENNVPQ